MTISTFFKNLPVWFCLAGFAIISPAYAQTTSPCNESHCQNGGICVRGSSVLQSTTASQEVEIGEFHCACQPGWTGEKCDERFDSCSETSPCDNGGVCVLGLRDEFNNEQYFCDCTNALDEDGNKFVGKWCEHQAVTYCDGQGSFCVHGECNPAYLSDEDPRMCLCNEGHGGPHCEFEKGDVPKCDLDCQNGHCVMGETSNAGDMYNYWDNSPNQDMMHCRCKEGYDGPLCEHRKTSCGDGHCYNGSKCVEKIGTDGKSHFHCDCTAANTDEASFAGRFCQYKATTYCSTAQHTEGALFCVNNGRCKDDVFEGCECDEPFTGFSCEFRSASAPVSAEESSFETTTNEANPNPGSGEPTGMDASIVDDPNYISCNAPCQNGGVCRKGAKDIGALAEIAHNVEHLNQTSNMDFEHCVCPSGYAGTLCEIKVDVCGQGEHLCLHGSKCVSDGEFHACDCSNADQGGDSEVFAGRSCEHKATDICTKGELEPGKPLSFCTNSGTCKKQVSPDEPHPGCDCSEEWMGPHCELRASSEPGPDQSASATNSYNIGANESQSSGRNGFLIVEIIFLVLCLVLFAALILSGFSRYVENKKRQAATAESVNFINDQEPYEDEPNISPHRDSVIDPFPKRFHSSSSDPFVSLVETESTRKASRAHNALEPVEIC